MSITHSSKAKGISLCIYLKVNIEGGEIPAFKAVSIEAIKKCKVIFVGFHKFIDPVSFTDEVIQEVID